MFAMLPVVAEVEVAAGGLMYVEELDPGTSYELFLDRTATGNNPAFVKRVLGSLDDAIAAAREWNEPSDYCGDSARRYLIRNRQEGWPGALGASPVKLVLEGGA
jgi:hypothetical protein